MNYRRDFEKCFDYIDNNLKKDMSTQILADYLGYSIFHFCRIFHLYKEMTPMEYILNRRLQASIVDIQAGKKVIDIAMEYHFETASGFSKAFKKYFHKTPSQFRNASLIETLKESPDIIKESPDIIMECPIKIDIKEINSFWICGLSIDTDYVSTEFTWQMAAFWDKYEEEHVEERLYNNLNPIKHGEIGLCMKQNDANSKVVYMMGVMAKPEDNQSDWKCIQISGGKYAVFTTPPVNMLVYENMLATTVRNVLRYIFNEWFLSNEYEYDSSRMDFEFYDERCHYLKDSVMEIYIPIK